MKFSVCNAVLRTMPIPAVFDLIAETGFDGVEIAPRTIASSLDEIGASHIKACRKAVESAGLEVVGVHTIFGRDPQYHILQPEPETRERTLKAIIRAVELCGELGGHVVVFGSPWQRNVPEGMSHHVAIDVAAGLIGHANLLNALEATRVTFCFEPLSEDQTDFVNRAAKAVELVDRIDHPRVGMMLDGYSISWESRPSISMEDRSGNSISVSRFTWVSPSLSPAGPMSGKVTCWPCAWMAPTAGVLWRFSMRVAWKTGLWRESC